MTDGPRAANPRYPPEPHAPPDGGNILGDNIVPARQNFYVEHFLTALLEGLK